MPRVTDTDDLKNLLLETFKRIHERSASAPERHKVVVAADEDPNARPTTTAAFAEKYRPFSLAVPDFHREWYAAMDGTDTRIILLAPREHAKTSTVLTKVIREICENPQIRIGILSQSGALANGFMRDVRLTLEWNADLARAYRENYPNGFIGRKWTDVEITVAGSRHQKDVTLFAAGSGSQVTGRHADLLIFDDIESSGTVLTPERRAKTRSWFSKDVIPVLSPGGRSILMGTRKHFDDLYATLLKPGSGWKALVNSLSAILPDGTPLWKDRWTIEGLMKRKDELDALDITSWSQEYENNPIAGTMQMFNPLSWPTWTVLPDDLMVYQTWDLAISEKRSADFSACATVGVDEFENVYILNMTRGHYSISDLALEIDARYNNADYAIRRVGYERPGFQAPIIREILKEVHCSTVALPVQGDKVEHARRLEAKGAAGKIFRPSRHVSWWTDLAIELSQFPMGAHDDQVDALSYAIDLALPLHGGSAVPISIERHSAWGGQRSHGG